MTQNMVCKPENLVFTPSQGLEGSVLDSCEFRGFVPNFGLYIPLSAPPLTGVCINIMDLDVTWLSGINSVLNR